MFYSSSHVLITKRNFAIVLLTIVELLNIPRTFSLSEFRILNEPFIKRQILAFALQDIIIASSLCKQLFYQSINERVYTKISKRV